VVLDCGELERVGAVLPAFADLFARVPIVNIDHHVSNTGFGEIDWIDTQAAATCEMLTLLVRVLGVPLTAGGGMLAASLLAGIIMDTATFQHPNVTPRTLRAAAELVAAGAPLSDLARLIYRTKPEGQLRLFGRVLARMESDLDGRLLWSDLLESDLAATGTVGAQSEGLIDLMSQSETAEIALLFKEEAGYTRVSVRTRDGGPDATTLVGIFGGGGHARAAGATVYAGLEVTRRDVLEAARRLIRGEALPGEGAR
jgi:phosphoesterase RecJ-like protein